MRRAATDARHPASGGGIPGARSASLRTAGVASYAPSRAGATVQNAAAAAVARQGGVATARQLVAWGWTTSTIARRAAAGQWQRLHRGVFLLHSGPRSWRERAHAALLYVGPGAALSHSSAAFVHGFLPRPGPRIEVSVPHERWVRPTAGVEIHRRRSMPFAAGRLTVVGEDATVVDLLDAAGATDAAVSVVATAVLKGLLPDRILTEAGTRSQLRHRTLLVELLGPGSEAIESALEYRYARDVERAHRLPRGATQVRQAVGGRWIRADRLYRGMGVRVELDGQLAHPFGATDQDVWRDNAVVLAHDEVTLRYRWRHVAADPCATAVQVVSALVGRGWQSSATACGPPCPLP